METVNVLSPGAFGRQLLNALEASEGRTRRRKRDQTPDTIGLGIKRELLAQMADEDPAPEALEGWLMARILAQPASGAMRAMCGEILDDYRLATHDAAFRQWLAAGAPSEDAAATPSSRSGEGRGGGDGPGGCCMVELLGPARLLAGVKDVAVDVTGEQTVGQLIPALGARCPALVGTVLDLERGALADGYMLNRNGRDFLIGTHAVVRPGDRLLLLCSSAGG